MHVRSKRAIAREKYFKALAEDKYQTRKYARISLVNAIARLAAGKDLYYVADYTDDDAPIYEELNIREYNGEEICEFLNENSEHLVILR